MEVFRPNISSFEPALYRISILGSLDDRRCLVSSIRCMTSVIQLFRSSVSKQYRAESFQIQRAVMLKVEQWQESGDSVDRIKL